jgi:sulfate-transporting ATPase
VLGLNGSGKSTLLKIMAGVDKEIEGEAIPMPGLKIGYLPQEPQLNPEHTVRESVEEAMGEVFAAKAKLEEVYAAYAEEDADFDALAAEQARWRPSSPRPAPTPSTSSKSPPTRCACRPGTPRSACSRAVKSAASRCAACCCPSPTCCCSTNPPTTWTLNRWTGWSSSCSVSAAPWWPSPTTATSSTTRPSGFWNWTAATAFRTRATTDWLLQKQNRLEAEQKGEEARAKALKKELEWVRQNAKGRQAKSKARIARFEELSDYEYQKRNETQEIFIPVADRLGSQVIEFKNVSKSFGDRLLIDNLSFNIPAGAIVGIIGPNGAGKSTLFKLIAGKEQPDSGEVVIGQTVKMAFVDQHRDVLANEKTVWEDVSGGLDMLNIGKFQMASRAYCGRFNFNGGDQQKKVGMLSGGERGRLHLAKTLIQGGNVLLLDEPSNDLDVETLRALEDALLEYAGTVLVISHDRWFLDRIATHILAAEGDSQWTFFVL